MKITEYEKLVGFGDYVFDWTWWLNKLRGHVEKLINDNDLTDQDKRSILGVWRRRVEEKVTWAMLSDDEFEDTSKFLGDISLKRSEFIQITNLSNK